jgi:hypothetical protein
MREGLEGETYAGRYVVADARLASPVAAGEGTVVFRAGFARLSGWQPVGNWVASAGEFSSLPVGVIPTTSRESRRTVCEEKWPRRRAERDRAYRTKAETIPRGGGSFLSRRYVT